MLLLALGDEAIPAVLSHASWRRSGKAGREKCQGQLDLPPMTGLVDSHILGSDFVADWGLGLWALGSGQKHKRMEPQPLLRRDIFRHSMVDIINGCPYKTFSLKYY